MDERRRFYVGWIKRLMLEALGSMDPHLTATIVIPRPIHGLEVGRPHLPTAILAKTDTRNRPSTASGARIRSIKVKRW
jgi:hypothetical protein